MTAGSRPGLLQCLCGPFLAPVEDGDGGTVPLPLLAGEFAAAVASQVLCLSALPLAGAQLAPAAFAAHWPVAALVGGSALATLPAALLTGAFGRRAALALGASLGMAGGALAAWAIVTAHLPLLVVGALWLGIAQGFGICYRHHAAGAGSRGAASLGLVFAAGAGAALAAPSLARFAEAQMAPYAFAGSIVAAALCHLLALGLALSAPAGIDDDARSPPAAGATAWPVWLGATAAAGLAWFAMGRLMATAPVGLTGCGLSFGAVSGAVAWHVVAMYLPALAVPRLLAVLSPARLAFAAATMIAVCLAWSAMAPGESGPLVAVYLLVGAGWALCTVTATLMLARERAPRRALAAHDALIFLAAFAGILRAG